MNISKKMVTLFDHTLTSISALDAKLETLSNKLSLPQPPSSGVSFDSSLDEPLPRHTLTANKTTISFATKPPHAPNIPLSRPNTSSDQHTPTNYASNHTAPVDTTHPASSPPHASSSVNDSIIAILDKLVESKTAKAPTNLSFPSFSGNANTMQFNRWSTLVCGILSTSEWAKLYDPSTNSHVTDGSVAPTLNNHLYSAILVTTKGPAGDYAASRKDLHGNGVGLLTALRHAYRNVLTPSDLITLQQKFQNHSRPNDQPIESFATDLQAMYQDIIDNMGGPVPSPTLSITSFITWDQIFHKFLISRIWGISRLNGNPLKFMILFPSRRSI